MTKIFCDRCGKEGAQYYGLLSWMGNNGSDFCDKCKKAIIDFIKNKPKHERNK